MFGDHVGRLVQPEAGASVWMTMAWWSSLTKIAVGTMGFEDAAPFHETVVRGHYVESWVMLPESVLRAGALRPARPESDLRTSVGLQRTG